ncbi:MAG: DUF3786 domain-containing protein [Deltaproteobacteria bacterium]|nr:DUF3786 domain-containing protein [Deltaproteobacteria bacterium]
MTAPDHPGNFAAGTPAELRLDFAAHPFWDELQSLPHALVCEKSGSTCVQEEGGPAYVLEFLGRPWILRPADRSCSPPPGSPEPGYEVKVVLLAYLAMAATGPSPGLAGRETGPHGLPGGDLFFKGPHDLPKAQLADAFGEEPEALARAAEALGAESIGKLAWKIRILPLVEIYWYLEPSDDEFPAEARYNFDAHVCYYLTLDMLFMLTNYLADRLIALKGA